ncbi:unnamed protein product [Prunus armeniaca]
MKGCQISAIIADYMDIKVITVRKEGSLLQICLKGIDLTQVGQDTIMEKESGEDVVENLRGLWTNVPPRRKTKTGAKNLGGESNSLKPHGSHFDALEKTTEKFGTETTEAFVDVIPTNKVTNKINYNVWVKIWTKFNKAKGRGRPAMKDISNMSMASSSRGETDQQKKVNPKNNTQIVKLNKGKLDSSVLQPSQAVSVSDKVSEWVRNQNVQSTKWAFIFGHQPPNITGGHHRLVNEREADKLIDALASDATDSFCTVEDMNLAEGQDHTIGEDGNVIGASSTKFKVNMMELIKIQSIDILFGSEPRIGGDKALKMVKSLGFSNFEVVDPTGFSGDFNDMLKTNDKMGGILLHRLRGFKKWFDENNMIDLGYSGPKFTWTNNRVFERIDRVQWDQGSSSTLAKSHSLVEPLKHWNIAVFGDLKQRKTQLLARLNGIQQDQEALCSKSQESNGYKGVTEILSFSTSPLLLEDAGTKSKN